MNPYKLIPLTRGMVTAVSPEDAQRVSEYKWHANIKRTHHGGVVGRLPGGTYVRLARFILQLQKDDQRLVDHKNGNVYDNRRCNLRYTNFRGNAQNCALNHGKCKFRGVYPRGKRFIVNTTLGGKGKYIGCFEDETEAAQAYDEFARKAFGEFARLNFPKKDELPPDAPPEVVNQLLQEPTSKYAKSPRSTTQFIGVLPKRNKWQWVIGHKRKYYRKAGFATAEKAARARDRFIRKHRWPHQLNWPKEFS